MKGSLLQGLNICLPLKELTFESDRPDIIYGKYRYYSKLYLESGIELWNKNHIKTKIIPFLNLDKIDLYYLDKKKLEDLTEAEKKLAIQNHELLLKINPFFSEYNIPLDTSSLLMAIAVERVLKGHLLNNGYIIHEYDGTNRLIPISAGPEIFPKLKTEVYNLRKFTNYHILKQALPNESKKNLIRYMNGLIHLKKLRDREAHLVSGISGFQIYDILLYKSVNILMDKSADLVRTLD